MELLSQLDVQNPDHVSVITKGNRVIISVRKDGSDVTLGFPISVQNFETVSRLPVQQEGPAIMSSLDSQIATEYQREAALAYLEKLAREDQHSVA